MYALDFEYGDFSTGLDNDKAKLSDFGFIICQFDATGGANIASAGSTITFNKTPINYGKRFDLVSTSYEECLETTFDICKNPDIYEYKDMEISDQEKRNLIVWLSRHKFMDFKLIKEDSSIKDVFYKASFNIEEIWISGKLYGLRLNLTTDKPYGYGEPVTTVIKDILRKEMKSVVIETDEIGYIPLKIELTSKLIKDNNERTNSIRIRLTSNSYENDIIINNCFNSFPELTQENEGVETNVESVVIDGENQTIFTKNSVIKVVKNESDNDYKYQTISNEIGTRKMYNDFNYTFPRVLNKWNKNNKKTLVYIKVTGLDYPYTGADLLTADLTLTYTPIIKGSIS